MVIDSSSTRSSFVTSYHQTHQSLVITFCCELVRFRHILLICGVRLCYLIDNDRFCCLHLLSLIIIRHIGFVITAYLVNLNVIFIGWGWLNSDVHAVLFVNEGNSPSHLIKVHYSSWKHSFFMISFHQISQN